MSTFARLCCSVVLLCSASIAALAQQTLRVPQDFPTVQTAINAAGTGDTVLVAPGTYFENLTIDTRQITLKSVSGAGLTLLDGQHLGAVLTVRNAPGLLTVVDGFTFQNGSAPASPPTLSVLTGGGLYAINSGLTVSNSTFRSIIGPSVLASGSTLALRNSTITTTDGSACTNAGVGQHSGVYLLGDSVITAAGAPVPSTLVGNTIFGDGSFCAGVGISLQGVSATTLIQNNILRNNLSAFDALDSAFNLIQNLIYDNGLGAIGIEGPASTPSTGPATMFLTSNTLVNNHTNLQDLLNGPSVTEINILNSAAQVAMRDNIVVGTSQYAVLFCANDSPRSTANDTPLLLDHNDLFNTSGGLVLSGNCFPNLAAPLTLNGNLSVDPRFSSSTNLYPIAGSPILDAGITLVDAPPTDIAGNPRLADSTGKGYPIIDLGAYERSASISATNATALTLVPATFALPPGNLLLSASASQLSATGSAPLTSGSITVLLNGTPTSSVATLGPDGNATLFLPLTSPGVYALTATLSPSLNFAPATSPVVYVLVTNAPAPTTTLTLTAAPTTQVANHPVTLTVHLGSTTTSGSTTTPGPVPPGDVTLLEAGTILSVLQPDATGLVTFTIPSPTPGNHTYTVVYAGNTTFGAASASTAVSITAPVATSLTATATPNPAPLTVPVLCAAHVAAASGPAPTGSVSFTDGATLEGTVRLTDPAQQGLVSLVLYNLSLGLHTITVTFQPDPGFSPSFGACTVNVGGDATTTTLASSKNPATTTDTVTYTVSVTHATSPTTSSAPPGSVTLAEGNTLLASAPLVTGPAGGSTATLPLTLGAAGLHILTATYIPATAATFTSSTTLSETITAPPPVTTVLSATPNPAIVGQTITLSAIATSPAALPSPATITFSDGATVLGAAPLSAGTASLSLNTLSIGSHPITATLTTPGSGTIRSTSNSLAVEVKGLDATLSLVALPSFSALATSPVTLNASLTTASALPAGTSASGTVTFLDGNLALGTGSLSADGHATFTTSTLSAGAHLLSASFSGNTLLSPALSAPVAESITPNPTGTALSVFPAAATAFAPVVLLAHVASSTSTARVNTLLCPPSCVPITVTFFADGPGGHTSLGSVPVDASGNASLTLTPSAGTLSITATFSGSALFSPSSSSASALTITPATTALTLSANPNPVYQHGSVTVSAALTAPGIPASALAGTITFLEGSTTLGTASLAAARSFGYSPGSVGPHTLTAVFSGDSDLSGASATTTVTVLPSDFVLTLKDPSLTIATTHHAPTTLSINTTGSLADLIDLSCDNLPQFAHCTFSPATQDLTAGNTSTGTLMLDTDALLNYSRLDRSPAAPSGPGSALTAILALSLPTTLLAAVTRLRRRRRGGPRPDRVRLPHLLAMLLASVTAATLSGCSGLYPSHVAPGTYTVTVTGHARSTGIEHSTTLTLTVTP